MIRLLIRQITSLHWGYLSDEILHLFQDGNISDKKKARVLAHLNRCLQCRARAAQIVQDRNDLIELRSVAVNNANISEAELAAKIEASIHNWSVTNLPSPPPKGQQGFAQTEAGRQVAAVLGIYLGQRAASALLQSNEICQIPKQESLANAESALRVLLGRKSAAAVEVKLLQIVRKFPESAGGSAVS